MAANQFLNTSWVSMEILRLLLNKLVVSDYFSRSWNKEFNKEFAVGATVTVKLPWRPMTSDGMGYQPQSIQRLSTTLTLDQWVQIGFEWDDYEAAVKIERSEKELRENYFEPAAAAFAQEIDSRNALWAYQNCSTFVGILGADPTSAATYYLADQRMEEKACPPGEKAAIVSGSMVTALGSNMVNQFHPADEVTKMWKKRVMGELADLMFFESNSLYAHTAGTWQNAVTVNGAGQTGNAIVINATAGDTFKVGDKFGFNAVNFVNPMTRRIVGKKAQATFTVTTALTAAGGGVDVLNILPAIYGPGSNYQNVDALPIDTAALTLFPGTTSPNGKVGTVGVALSKYAFGLVGAKIYVPTAVEKAGSAQDPASGLSIRKVKAWDPQRSMQVNRMDSLFGRGNLYQDQGAVAILGA